MLGPEGPLAMAHAIPRKTTPLRTHCEFSFEFSCVPELTPHCLLAGLAGFARLCPGDQYEVSGNVGV